ncbi:putative bifunctional diguanylate cyclase/phosphodiesterase [Litoreibacter roseus]|uniref:Diguanylate cyclase n=1 Tax=Litoreibacter roseus TaxID=2601869 RepID=A0A6N6JGA5_9RHOB|nr:GGDEF domain-containing phosphodiesterase [Litoreibacter roseus]GFE65155.1 diguanylate cyclase [Litoreibacter roseus]
MFDTASRSKLIGACVWAQRVMLAILSLSAVFFFFADGGTTLSVSTLVLATAMLIVHEGLNKILAGPSTPVMDRTQFVKHLDTLMNPDSKLGRSACIVLEIDDFDDLKMSWGREAAETASGETEQRLKTFLRGADTLAKLAENRFAIAIGNIRQPELGAVINMVHRLQDAATDVIEVDEASLHVSLSAGFCLSAQLSGDTGEAFLSSAISALTDARTYGPGAARGYSSQTPAQPIQLKATMENVLAALREGQIKPWFQPQVSTDTGMVTGFEALSRWYHPEKGLIQPADFLPELEAAGKMEDLSEAILQHALRALKSWDEQHLDVPHVAVNFATQELRNPGLVERIKWDVDRFDLDPSRLTIEILETVVSQAEDDVITRNIRALGAQGFRIDLDDFGRGHASLSNIRRFKVGRVKIDRSFVTRVDDDPEQQKMIAAIVSMAEQLEIQTVAEGVETVGEKSILSQLGCSELQGFSIARPMAVEETAAWLKAHAAERAKSSELLRNSR